MLKNYSYCKNANESKSGTLVVHTRDEWEKYLGKIYADEISSIQKMCKIFKEYNFAELLSFSENKSKILFVIEIFLTHVLIFK